MFTCRTIRVLALVMSGALCALGQTQQQPVKTVAPDSPATGAISGTPTAASIPALMSATELPVFTGGPPGSPVIDISPAKPCAIRSKPPLSASGPLRP